MAVPVGLPISGVVLADQVKSLDWRSRSAEFVCKLPRPDMHDVLAKLEALLTR